MMTFVRGVLVLAAGLVAGQALAAAPRDPSGVWLVEDGRARVLVDKCGTGGQQVCGFIVWLKPGSKDGQLDVKNPDARKAKRPLLGHQLLLGLKPNDDGRYEGEIYNSEDGKKYDVNVWVESGTLKVKGCLVAFLCSTQTWTKTSDVVPGQLTGAPGAPGGPLPDPEFATSYAAAAPKPAAPALARDAAKPKP